MDVFWRDSDDVFWRDVLIWIQTSSDTPMRILEKKQHLKVGRFQEKKRFDNAQTEGILDSIQICLQNVKFMHIYVKYKYICVSCMQTYGENTGVYTVYR